MMKARSNQCCVPVLRATYIGKMMQANWSGCRTEELIKVDDKRFT